MKKNNEVYRDEKYVLGYDDGKPYLTADGEKYTLSCHPYEPCLYITDKNGGMTAVHNAFDPTYVLRAFSNNQTVTSITGFEYNAKDFCRMVEYAADMVNITIDYAERVFGAREKKKNEPEKKETEKQPDGKIEPRLGTESVVTDDPAYKIIAEYPDSVIDYCIVNNDNKDKGYNGHWFALVWACRRLFVDDDDTAIWRYDVGKANAKLISADALFAPVKDGVFNYRKAFLHPPYETNYKNADFDKINAALFPNGTDKLEVYEWTTDWSEYFDEGHEWWGTLCCTVHDKSLDRFVVIMASATD